MFLSRQYHTTDVIAKAVKQPVAIRTLSGFTDCHGRKRPRNDSGFTKLHAKKTDA